MKYLRILWENNLWALISALLMGFAIIGSIILYLETQLPDVSELKNAQLQIPMQIYSRDGLLMAEFGTKRRIPITYDNLPTDLIHAIVATEDQRYFEHGGVDFWGMLRAVKNLVSTGEKSQGGSTITMQVARNFYLSPKKTYLRKIKELLLAIKIEHNFSKEEILTLYANKIFLGNRAYGFGAAAYVYYGKRLSELTLPQLAMLAGLPKAPSALNPLANPDAALKRRHHVLSRMYDLGYLSKTAFTSADQTPLSASYHSPHIQFHAPYVSEMARQILVERMGDSVYNSGIKVYLTVDSHRQAAAESALQTGLLNYEKRHGYRGPEAHWQVDLSHPAADWLTKLKPLATIADLQPAVVISVQSQTIKALLKTGETVILEWPTLQWARKEMPDLGWSPAPKTASDILKIGDVIRIKKDQKGNWGLYQLPNVQGALVALNPKNGAIQALIGGFDFGQSNFNRATQGLRQTGSCFKPFIYAAALAKGDTLATIINDSPIVMQNGDSADIWRPENASREFFGPTRLREGIVYSRNLVSIRLLRDIDIPYALDYLKRFGFDIRDFPEGLSLALGSASVSPLDLAKSYAVFANGGYPIAPFLIHTIRDQNDKLLYRADPLHAPPLSDNPASTSSTQTSDSNIPEKASHLSEQTIQTDVAYLITQVLRDVIRSGTGRAAQVLGRHDLAGKTGTTNDQVDAWFAGFNPDLVSVVWVGFDSPTSLKEYGAQAALPIWIDFMGSALKGVPERNWPEPPNITTVRIDPETGLLARPDQKKAIFEQFRSDHVPEEMAPDNAPANNPYDDQGEPAGPAPLF